MVELVPGHLTLAEVRQLTLESGNLDTVLGLVRIDRTVRVRFLWARSGEEFDDSSRMSEFRQLASIGLARVVIDDGGGGVRAVRPESVS